MFAYPNPFQHLTRSHTRNTPYLLPPHFETMYLLDKSYITLYSRLAAHSSNLLDHSSNHPFVAFRSQFCGCETENFEFLWNIISSPLSNAREYASCSPFLLSLLGIQPCLVFMPPFGRPRRLKKPAIIADQLPSVLTVMLDLPRLMQPFKLLFSHSNKKGVGGLRRVQQTRALRLLTVRSSAFRFILSYDSVNRL